MGDAARAGQGAISVGCRIGDAKASSPLDICALFAARVAAAVPGREVVRTADGPADLTLEVTRATAGSLTARVLREGQPPGPSLGMARADAPLDDAAVAAFLDGLLAGFLPI